jgi:hypothetical protein
MIWEQGWSEMGCELRKNGYLILVLLALHL